MWSDSISTFCDDVKAEPGVAVISLDWGFNEQLDFLCDRRPLSEPIWADRQFVVTSKSFCLVHPPEYTVFRSGWDFYNAVRDKFRRNMSIQAYRDRQGKVAFYALRVYGAGNMSMQAYRDRQGKVAIYALRVSGFEPGPKRDEEIEAAIAHFRRALKIRPDSAQDHFNLGALLEGRGSVAEAIAHYQRALEIRPDDAEVRYNLGMALYRSGAIGEAVLQLREAVRLAPNNLVFANRLAWVLATCPEASIRNGAEAVRLAQWVTQISQGQQPTFLGTLAAAYAETGDFSRAIEVAERAVTLASTRGDKAPADILRTHINRYHAGSPYHEIPTERPPEPEPPEKAVFCLVRLQTLRRDLSSSPPSGPSRLYPK